MTETLTESFCERCGTRYEFKAPTRLNPLRKTRGLIGGLKNYVMSQDALSDAIGDSMRSEEGQLASAQLEAFHESFNFCIDCRQYTCVNCWNDDAGRCRSCVPIPGTDDLAERLAASLAGTADAIAEPTVPTYALENGDAIGLETWPTSDLIGAATNGQTPEPWQVADGFVYETERTGDDEPVKASDGFVYDSPVEPEPVVAEAEPEPEPEPVVAEAEPMVAALEPEPEPEPMVAALEPEPEPERPLLRVVSWDEDAAYDLEPEAVVAEEIEPEPIIAEEVEPEPVAAEVVEPEAVVAEEIEPEPIIAEVVEPEPVAAEVVEPEPIAPRRMAPIGDTILRFPQRPAVAPPESEETAAEADGPGVAARRAQLDLLGLGDPGEGPVQPSRPAVVPYRSRGAAVGQGDLSVRAAAHGATFWEASAREVANAAGNVGVQNCGQCGLSLSANARFCRRCGTRQAQSA